MAPASSAFASSPLGGDYAQSAAMAPAVPSPVLAASDTAVTDAHENLGLSHDRQARASHLGRAVPVKRLKRRDIAL
ncbi:hypothetical protein [Kordiimonas aestuarii]|uniref:hypothetical protein n=1 Tax=Kordiimonas aestuarii TaxID=1005925 RepID=UPI0021D1C167|nr:hypothetical protein [Kordiimonas aestuarii]